MRVAVCGANGRMGKEVVKTILNTEDFILTGAFDREESAGVDAGENAGCKNCGVKISSNLEEVLANCDCIVDFTNSSISAEIIKKAIEKNVDCIVGATGHSDKDLEEIKELAKDKTKVLIVPNFSIGAVLMMRFAKEASIYFDSAEIIELHHEKKMDAPSGTSIKTLKGMLENRESFLSPETKKETMKGARGAEENGIHIHSVRLPGMVAHQEVIFGKEGEYMTIRHDSTSRICFMSGVLVALRNLDKISKGLTIGLEAVM